MIRTTILRHLLLTISGSLICACMAGGVVRAQPPATYTVTVLTDNGDPGELRGAITAANANPGSTVVFAQGLSGTISLMDALPTISAAMTIDGSNGTVTIDGRDRIRPFTVDVAPVNKIVQTVSIIGLTIENGDDQVDYGGGGAIVDWSGKLVIDSCNFLYNHTNADNNTNGGGGAIEVVDSAVISNSSFLLNACNYFAGNGGALCGFGPIDMVNCTLGSNTAYFGGAVFMAGATFNATNCTFATNAGQVGGAIDIDSGSMVNCIFWERGSSEEIVSFTPVILTNCDIEGGLASIPHSYVDKGGNINEDPLFDTRGFDFNGGSTYTIALLAGSPVYLAGTAAGAPVVDQRGITRSVPPSIGAYDAPAVPKPVISPNGGTITYGSLVSLTDIPGASIFYTLDGSTPTTASTVYTGPLTVTASQTITAFATKPGLLFSSNATATFTVIPTTPTNVTATPDYQQVTLNWTPSKGAISYSVLQGFFPDLESPTPVARDIPDKTVTITGLTNGVSYYFKVFAVNAAGLPSGLSKEVVATPSGTVNLAISAATSVNAGSPLTFTVKGNSVSGSSVTGYTGPVTFTSTDPLAVLPPTTTLTNGAAVVTVTLKTSGPQTVTVSDAAGKATAGTSNVVTVIPGPATGVRVSGAGSIIAGTATPIAVNATDTYGNTATGYSGTVNLASSDSFATVPAQLKLISGVGTASVTFGSSGLETVTATDTVVKTITGTSAPLSVLPAVPTITPHGGTVPYGQLLTISELARGATVYFTTDGSTPTSNSTKYTVPIALLQNETVNAIAIGSPSLNSPIASASFAVSAPTPKIFPAGGVVPDGQAVTITEPVGATVYYTTDGTTPTINSLQYGAPILLSSNLTIKAFAVAISLAPSAVATETYTVATPAPTISPNGGTVASGQLATISDSLPSNIVKIYYTTDGTTPTTSSKLYSGPILITKGQTIQAIAVAAPNGTTFAASPVTSATFTVSTPVLHVFPAGLQMISAPVDYSAGTLSAEFGAATVTLAAWANAGSNSYTISPTIPANTLHPGVGYWARFGAATNLYDLGSHIDPNSPYSIALRKGWNLIGNPRSVATKVASLQVNESGNALVSLSQAVADEALQGQLYTYQAGDTQYQVLGASSSLQPYAGFWIYAYQSCSLVFP
ncbi:MAG TPA: chitobiase/beta-hexosaminidase C-terminal domain-containing protein [Capsulimonadaceae bacterium]